jgi:hypothetical protein
MERVDGTAHSITTALWASASDEILGQADLLSAVTLAF